MSDAQISLFKSKYLYNAGRPITYIRTVMGQPAWNTLIPTPPHPEYPAGHSVTSGAGATSEDYVMSAADVAQVAVLMASLPPEVNLYEATILPNNMRSFIGRG